MPTLEDRLAMLEKQYKLQTVQLNRALSIANAMEGRPSDATLTLPHNDSWIFEDNVDSTHPANLRYVIAANMTKIVSARLSIKLTAYRTYSNFSVTATGTESQSHDHSHNHASAAHSHSIPIAVDAGGNHAAWWDGTQFTATGGGGTAPTNSTTPGGTGTDATGERQTHTHSVSGSSFLGVSEGAVATGVTVSFDGVDQTVALGGPFAADQIELNVRPYLATTQGAWHVISMQPSGLGRIEAHLRLGVYVSAGQLI